jgi:hypothetical protein
MLVLVGQLFRLDQPALQQARDKRARASERVNDMHALAAQRLPEFGLQNVVDAVDDEIHHLHRRIDNAQPLGHFREGIAEKLVVQLDNDFLFALGIGICPRRAASHWHRTFPACQLPYPDCVRCNTSSTPCMAWLMGLCWAKL